MRQKHFPEPFRRKTTRKLYFYYPDPNTGIRRLIATGCETKREARTYIRAFVESQEKGETKQTFSEYSTDYYQYDICPHTQRYLAEGKTIGRTHVNQCRRMLDQHILTDPIFPKLKMREIKRGDILSLRERLRTKLTINTLNKAISAVKTIFAEAYFREDIQRDPGSRIGPIKYAKQETAYLTMPEIHALLGPEHWPSETARLVFAFAASTGMRAGEVLAMQWRQVDFINRSVNVDVAWKNSDELGLPKWNKTREIPLSAFTVQILEQAHSSSIRIQPDDLVFCYDDGGRFGPTWWKKNFNSAAVKSGVAVESKQKGRTLETRRGNWLKPHSLRHSLNTYLLDSGMDPYKVRLYFGWSESQTRFLSPVQMGYTHSPMESIRDIAQQIDAAFLGVPILTH